jgi:glycosyltransferase involved in cell wall biosynthesis
MNSPTVSAVIPAYNRARFLPAAVDSIRAQTYPCMEIVIVDDGSTDDTERTVQQLGAGVRYIRQANAGPAAARNRGIREARGELVAFLDTDDRWLPDKLALQVDVIRRDPTVALVCADMAIEDEHGTVQVASNFRQRGMQAFFSGLGGRPIPEAPRRLLEVNFVNTSTVLARRDVLLALDGFDRRLRYGEDLELWLRIAARHPIACVPSVQEVRVEHSSNVTKSIEPMLLGYVRMAEVIREWAGGSMPAWGVDSDRYVAASLADLGYWYFAQGRLNDARKAFQRSLRETPTVRAAAYGLASLLPPFVVNGLRSIKSLPRRIADP